MGFLPITLAEMNQRGWDAPDFVLVSGDAYVDHPSFGTAIISRVLEAMNFNVCILAQPDWKTDTDFTRFPKPKLGFLVTAGNIDSMVNHYTVSRKRRDKDNYTDKGEMDRRPDRATIVYAQNLRRLYPDTPIILGGIEASLRRLSHYDFWDDKVRASILIDAMADLLIYGMAENTIIEVAEAMRSGLAIKDITYIRGTVWKSKEGPFPDDALHLPTFLESKSNKDKYADSFVLQYNNTDAILSKPLLEDNGAWKVIQNPPSFPLKRSEMDWTYSLPFERTYHPSYTFIPAIEEVQFSLTSNRGCFGSCRFCALTAHQGRVITSRSQESLVIEAKKIIEMKDFKGYIHDLGGPTANFHQPSCEKQLAQGVCLNKECLHPKACVNLTVTHTEYLGVLRALRALPKVKKVFIRSGIRYDYLMYDKDESFFDELIQHHISGQLKVAPEHINDKVLDAMGKPRRQLYESFVKKYEEKNKQFGKNQFLVPYLMSSHPGSDLNAAIELALYLKKIGHVPQQVQDFYPTPFTVSTCMYYTEKDPFTKKAIYVAKTNKDKSYQRVLMQYTYPQNQRLVFEALKTAGRLDLVGFDKHCLIKPMREEELRKTAMNRTTGKSPRK